MYTYKCDRCGGFQYSSSDAKAGEPCIYCKGQSVALLHGQNDPKKIKLFALKDTRSHINYAHVANYGPKAKLG